MIYFLSHAHSPCWFNDFQLFRNRSEQVDLINTINRDVARSDEVFIGNFSNKYSDPAPPSWMTLEIVSFNTNPNNKFAGKISALLKKYPGVPIQSMGISQDSFEDPLWDR